MTMTSLARRFLLGRHLSTSACRASILDRVQVLAADVAQRANTVTGFTQIETIKGRISATEKSIEALKLAVEQSRSKYSSALGAHSSVQRAINDLLHRKSEWTSQDVEKLSQLYREDHQTEKRIEETRTAVELEESSLEQERALVGKLMMERYREEQIWSDKIRQFSTWGTMILMAVNLCLFVVVQLFLEPWKRRRLVAQFEERLSERLGETQGTCQEETSSNPIAPSFESIKEYVVEKWACIWTHIQHAVTSRDKFFSECLILQNYLLGQLHQLQLRLNLDPSAVLLGLCLGLLIR